MIKLVVKSTNLPDLSIGNLGGKMWSELKSNPESCPPWKAMMYAPVWKDDRFKSLWDVMKGEVEQPSMVDETQLATEQGEVCSLTVRRPRRT